MQWSAEARKFHNLSAEISDFINAARNAAEERRAILKGLHDDAGLNYREIGQLVGLSTAMVWQIISGKI